MIQQMKDLLVYAWFYSPFHRKGPFADGVPVLTYHRIGDRRDLFFPSLSTALFEEQIRYISKWYRIISLQSLVESLESGTLPERAVVLTFDDGYQDTYTVAWPILKRYGANATTFLATGCIGTGTPLWTEELAWMFKMTRANEVFSPGSPAIRIVSLDSVKRRLDGLHLVKGLLKRLPIAERDHHIENLRSQLRVDGPSPVETKMLNWEQIRQLSGEGMDFGAHTVTHPILTRISEENVLEEMAASKADIEDRLQRQVLTFAYPNGTADDFDARVEAVARKVGFRCACSTIPKRARVGTDLFAIPRIYTEDRSLPRFVWRINHTID